MLIINELFSVFLFLIPLFIAAVVLKSPWFKGVMGEFVVNAAATLMLDKAQYHLIKNVTLPTEDGSTQIDHIVVSIYGIFVIETKNMKGWIFGQPQQKMWTQKIYKHSSRFQNPLHQNYKHVKTLQSLLKLSDEQVFSLIVFVGDAKFKTQVPENVTHLGGYIRFIKSKKQLVFSEKQVSEIIHTIQMGKLTPSFKTSREHTQHVKEIIEQKQSTPNCPKCGSPMVLREAKKGVNAGNQFWGCTRFPKCKGIINIQ